nr:EpsG family protein [Bifidobacterium breve]
MVRQTIATALFCCALLFVERNMEGKKTITESFLWLFSLIAIAVGFHYSALIYFVVIALLYLKLDKKNIFCSFFFRFGCSCTYLCCSYWYLAQRDKVWELYIRLLCGS